MRSIVISISDGLLPSRNGLGGFLKYLILKCLSICRDDFKMGPNEADFLCTLVPVVVDTLVCAYPELGGAKSNYIQTVIRHTDAVQKVKLSSALEITERYLKKLKMPKKMSGEQIWKLFKGDGSGDEISIDFIRSYCGNEKKIELDMKEFDRILLEMNEKSLRSMKNLRKDLTGFIELANKIKSLPKTDDSFKYSFNMDNFLARNG